MLMWNTKQSVNEGYDYDFYFSSSVVDSILRGVEVGIAPRRRPRTNNNNNNSNSKDQVSDFWFTFILLNSGIVCLVEVLSYSPHL